AFSFRAGCPRMLVICSELCYAARVPLVSTHLRQGAKAGLYPFNFPPQQLELGPKAANRTGSQAQQPPLSVHVCDFGFGERPPRILAKLGEADENKARIEVCFEEIGTNPAAIARPLLTRHTDSSRAQCIRKRGEVEDAACCARSQQRGCFIAGSVARHTAPEARPPYDGRA